MVQKEGSRAKKGKKKKEEEEEEGEVVARTPVQSHGTPAGGTIVDLPVRSGIVSRYLF